ncbi:MAG: Lrp/AsnC family transcriptional regulator [Lachnospiraceae bacterium]|nr:Lrp/AsnC family transcriptional regulator [Lachnospiraceae bacterium]
MREKILSVIEQNSRLRSEEIAALLGENIDEVRSEMRAMEAEKVIAGYHTIIDWDKTGKEKVYALIEVKTTPQRGLGFDRIAERIMQYPEVDSVYLMSGEFDFAIFLNGKTMREVANFVSEKLSPLDEIRGTATHFLLKKYKDHGAILDEAEHDERQIMQA